MTTCTTEIWAQDIQSQAMANSLQSGGEVWLNGGSACGSAHVPAADVLDKTRHHERVASIRAKSQTRLFLVFLAFPFRFFLFWLFLLLCVFCQFLLADHGLDLLARIIAASSCRFFSIFFERIVRASISWNKFSRQIVVQFEDGDGWQGEWGGIFFEPCVITPPNNGNFIGLPTY